MRSSNNYIGKTFLVYLGMKDRIILVSDMDFTDTYRDFSKVIGGVTRTARYFPAGFNQIRAMYSSHKSGFFRYALCLRALNPSVDSEKLFMYALMRAVDNGSSCSVDYMRYCFEQADEIKDPDIKDRKRVQFLSSAFFLPKREKLKWTNDIRSTLVREPFFEYMGEFPDAMVKDIMEDLGMSRTAVNKYKKEWRETNR